MKYSNLILKEFENNHILEAKYFLEKFPSWDKSTIYRNLEKLKRSGEIVRIESFDGVSKYELDSKCSHLHKTCKKCGNIEEIEIDKQKVLEVLEMKNEQNPTLNILTQGCDKCN